MLRMHETAEMEWSEEKCFQLIYLYQQHELLWQPKHSQHYNKLRKQDAWEKIAQEMNADVEVCKKKILSLLSSFRRENGKIRKSQGIGSIGPRRYETSWFAFQAMLFLQDKDEPRRLSTDLVNQELWCANPDIQAAESETSSIGTDGSSPTHNSIHSPFEPQFCESTSSITGKTPSRTRKKSKLDLTNDVLHTVQEHFKRPRENKSDDRFDIFAKTVAIKLREAEKMQRILAEKLINDVLFEVYLALAITHFHRKTMMNQHLSEQQNIQLGSRDQLQPYSLYLLAELRANKGLSSYVNYKMYLIKYFCFHTTSFFEE